ncbi:hypothetical protein SDJN02_24255, partial [Cucurbita argyrosperma subsp. argyrosperma]
MPIYYFQAAVGVDGEADRRIIVGKWRVSVGYPYWLLVLSVVGDPQISGIKSKHRAAVGKLCQKKHYKAVAAAQKALTPSRHYRISRILVDWEPISGVLSIEFLLLLA